MMRAVGVIEFGGPDALQVVELPEPQAGPDQVRIRVHAAAVNPTDTMFRAGAQHADRSDRKPPFIPGMDAAGVIDQVGPGVDRLKVGDRVVAVVFSHGSRGGAYAEQIVVPAASVVPIADRIDFAEAGSFMMNAATARRTLDVFGLDPGTNIAVTGAAGAYGGHVVELAKADGLRVIADASPADIELVRSLGADEVVARGDDVAGRIRAIVPDGVPALADGALLEALALPAIADGGQLAEVRRWPGPSERGIAIHAIAVADVMRETPLLQRLAEQAEQGVIHLRVAQVYPASKAAEAHRRLEAGGVRGRLMLDFTDFG